MKLSLLLLLPLPLLGQIQDPSAPWAGTVPAQISVTPELDGDVTISVQNSPLPASAVGQIARAIMGCNWVEYDSDNEDGYVTGVCRKWLKADATYLEGSVNVAPLVLGLRGGGSRKVTVTVWNDGAGTAAPPKGWRRQTYTPRRIFTSNRTYYTYTVVAPGFSELPPAFPVQIGEKWEASRLAAPLVFLLLGVPLLGLWLRRRALRQGARNTSIVWLNWILNGAFLFWLSTVRPTDITGFLYTLHLHAAVKLLIGVAMFSGPPLAAMASCLLILDPGGAEGREARWRLLRIAISGQAALIVPLGLFLAGTSSIKNDGAWAVACLPGAYVLYRLIAWYGVRLRFSGLQHVADGELTLRAAAIAQAAGAKLRGVYILRNRLAREVNAFATGQGVIILTQGLVEGFPAARTGCGDGA